MLWAAILGVVVSCTNAAAPEANDSTLPELGVNTTLNGWRPFPDDNPWNTPIDDTPVDPNSDVLIASIGLDDPFHPDFGAVLYGDPWGVPYIVVAGDHPKLPVSFRFAGESDPGPYPLSDETPIEGGPDAPGDRHVLVIDRDNWMLYELFDAWPGAGEWTAQSGAIFDLSSNALRPHRWTSADAAGLPILPGLVRYDEVVEQGEITHALRFTASSTRRAYVYPARHWASTSDDPNLPPMGMRVRLKADIDDGGFPSEAQVIIRALKKYGMMLADNGGDWFISGAPDPRWNDQALNTLKQLRGADFEVVEMGELVTP